MSHNQRPYSLTLRLFSTIVLGMLMLNALTIYTTHRLGEASQENILREYRQVQVMYANEISRQLRQGQERITSIGSSYLADMGTNEKALSDERQYEAIRCQTEITTVMRVWQMESPAITGYYIYGKTADVFMFSGDRGYTDSQWFRERLTNKNKAANDPFEQIEGWQLVDTPMGSILLFNTLRRDLCYGSWVHIGKLWSVLGLSNDDSHTFEIIKADEADFSEQYIDVPLEGTRFAVRQILSDSATALPTSVRVLQLLSYVMLLVLPGCWFVLRKLILKPLRELIRAIHEIDRGNTSYRIPEKATSYEFDQLNRQFNQSIEASANAQAKLYEGRLENDRIRIRYLTQQMQPHFVLNTLNLIYSMEPSQYLLMQNTIRCLSKYFRYIAHVSEPLVPIEAELEHVKNYFQLQQIRYPDNFTYEINCPEELKETLIPPIIIQTFAENAIKHSLTVGEQNRVDVSIDQEEGDIIHIVIHDSGTGYPEEILEKIHQFQKDRITQEGLGLGIQNTIERIDLIYEAHTDLRFSNAPMGGAQVDIYLPKVDSMENRKSHEEKICSHYSSILANGKSL